jgi:hypothetical protein
VKRISAAVVGYLEELNLIYNRKQNGVIEVPWSLESSDGSMWITVSDGESATEPFVIYDYILAVRVPENHRSAVAEYITRANGREWFAVISMDYDSGSISARSAVNFRKGEELAVGPIAIAFWTPLNILTRWSIGLMQVAFGSQTAHEAFANVLEEEDCERREQEQKATEATTNTGILDEVASLLRDEPEE